MPLNVGIVGLPNVGKSTIFNALTSAKAQAANYPFCTIDPNVGVVTVPDVRLDKIVEHGEAELDCADDDGVRRYRGDRRGGEQGRGAGEPVSCAYPVRRTRFCMWCGAFMMTR